MTTQDKLLLDILSLIERYQPSDWDAALKRLRDHNFRDRLYSVLNLLSELSRTDAVRRSELQERKHNKKEQARPSESKAHIFKLSTAELRDVLKKNNVKCSTKDSRERLLKKFSALKHSPAQTASEDSSSDYENWVNIIMRRK